MFSKEKGNKQEEEQSKYSNPVLEHYTCEGQMTIEDWILEREPRPLSTMF